MRGCITWGLLAVLTGVAGALLAHPAPADESTSVATTAPVVVELFTSQGCSSCPPADALLSELAAADPAGRRIIPLAFHVDYWDYIGWKDPFSTAEWSQRQRGYGVAFDADTIYTPQMVFNGQAHCVGSRRDCVQRELAAASKRTPLAEVELSVETGQSGTWVALLDARWLAPPAKRKLKLVAAIFETGLTTSVKRGENAKRTLHNDFVVRRLRDVGVLTPRQGAAAHHRIALELEPNWARENLGVVVFVQDERSREIVAAARWAGL